MGFAARDWNHAVSWFSSGALPLRLAAFSFSSSLFAHGLVHRLAV